MTMPMKCSDVAEVDVDHAQHQPDAEHEDASISMTTSTHRDPGQHHVAEEQQDRAEHRQLDQERDDERRRSLDGDEHLAREVHLLDQVAFAISEPIDAVVPAAEEVPRHQAAEQEQREALEPARIAPRRLDLEEHAKTIE